MRYRIWRRRGRDGSAGIEDDYNASDGPQTPRNQRANGGGGVVMWAAGRGGA